MEPVHAVCTETELIVTLGNGQKVVTPLWWYPRLLHATPEERANYELSPFGVHWPDVDEDLSIQGMLVGSRAPGAREPRARMMILHGALPSNVQTGLPRP